MPNVIVLADGAFGRRLGHEGRTRTNETNGLIKEALERSIPFPQCENIAKIPAMHQEKDSH